MVKRDAILYSVGLIISYNVEDIHFKTQEFNDVLLCICICVAKLPSLYLPPELGARARVSHVNQVSYL